jgi:ElaB/YqjD/DUF883 family membrane-anchored ribosome-binding protein
MTKQRSDYPLDYTVGPGDTAGDRMRELADSASDRLSHAADQALEYGEKAQEVAKNFKPYVEKSLKDQPMATLAAAAAVGFVLGALWKK